jgi:hypothetical protein
MLTDDLGAEWPALLDGAGDFPFAEMISRSPRSRWTAASLPAARRTG